MNKFQVFIDENKDILNDFAKKYIEKTDMPELLKKSISYFDFYSPFYRQRGLIIRSKETLNMVEIVREGMYKMQ